MAIITKVSNQKKPGRYNIFLDGQYAFSASEQTVAKFLLLKGQELVPEKIHQVKQYDLDAKATNLASKYLSYEPRTIYEVLQYLSKHNIDEESAQNAVNQLSEMGFLDDQKYVALALSQNLRIGTDGPASFSQKMLQKGITSEIVQLQLAKISDDQWLDAGTRVIKSMKNQVGKLAQRELERKMRTKLFSHGFSSSLADSIISKMNLQLDQCQQLEALKKQGIKAYKRFRRLSQKEREIKMRNYLYTHGFSSNEIESFIAGEIIPLSELAKY
ncbi:MULTISPECIES: recombination regulator RecX [unclassified Lactobacillus]|uniref:recombination regulator RecX n=1 Tax=unclassified Lactobacillus TaxID=2620435 RepID=UPI000EFAF85A|nr:MULTISPECIES: recombination regulator RecX [unclassified Lactobacillus]RMC24938.1 recombination regulator RecX [Lactobacillus sp. ESL0247]RMC29093.1 recombination regulator RecX [Lactobacillus sp. ESL0246]RMC32696.1 recombination regulator RecX [Lactobacillus sp. ESL0245]